MSHQTSSKLVVGILVGGIGLVAGITNVYLPFYSDMSERRRGGEEYGTTNRGLGGGSMWKNMNKTPNKSMDKPR